MICKRIFERLLPIIDKLWDIYAIKAVIIKPLYWTVEINRSI